MACINKNDAICLWAKLTESDIIVLSETWLKPSVTNNMIHIEGYNLFRTDHVNKGGGVAIYAKRSLNCCVETIKKPKLLEMCAIKLNLHNGADLTVVGSYHILPQSAV